MHRVVEKLAAFLNKYNVHKGTVLLGVSGGADSVALLRAMVEVREEHRLNLRVIHVDHGQRAASAADTEWVGELCGRLSIPCTVERLPTTGEASEERLRDGRYEVFKAVAAQVNARWVATAHTADDQTETVLHHILRGTSWRGLAGIPQVRALSPGVDLIRPLLAVTRVEIEDYLSSLGQSYRQDESNASPTFTRNRLRHTVLPLLRQEYGPQVDDSLRTLAGNAAELQTFIESAASTLLKTAILELTPVLLKLDCSQLTTQPAFVVRELFVELWQRQNWPRQAMTHRHWTLLAEVAVQAGNARHHLPGAVSLERRGNLLVLSRS